MTTHSSTATEKDFDILVGYIFDLQNEWELYQSLFLESDERRQVLTGGALGDANSIIRNVLARDILAAFCRLTDPKVSRGKRNLAVEFVVDEFNLRSVLSAELDELGKLRKELEPLRHKRIAHIDLDCIQNPELLPALSTASVKRAIELLEVVAQKISRAIRNTSIIAIPGPEIHMAAQADYFEACTRMADSGNKATFAVFEPVFQAVERRSAKDREEG